MNEKAAASICSSLVAGRVSSQSSTNAFTIRLFVHMKTKTSKIKYVREYVYRGTACTSMQLNRFDFDALRLCYFSLSLSLNPDFFPRPVPTNLFSVDSQIFFMWCERDERACVPDAVDNK